MKSSTIFTRSDSENTAAGNRKSECSTQAYSEFCLYTSECFSRLKWICICEILSENIYSTIQNGECTLHEWFISYK